MDIIISTFPRSGSNFLRDYLNQCTDLTTKLKTHDPIDSKFLHEEPVISIVRNPLASITSVVAMETVFFGHSVDSSIQKRMQEYGLFYSNIENAKVIVSYEELVSDPMVVANKLCSILGGTMNESKYEPTYKDIHALRHKSNYVVSSSKLDTYPMVARRIMDYDLSDLESLYAKSLDRIL